MKIKQFLTILVFVSLSLVPSISHAQATEVIKAQNTDVTVNQDGMVSMLDRIIYDFGSNQKHGIIRKINTLKTNTEGKQFQTTITDVAVTNERNQPVPFTTSTEGYFLVIKIGDANITVSGVKNYNISYKISGALTYFSDHDEFYWNITGNESDVVIEQSHVIVKLPKIDGSLISKGECFTGVSGSTDKNCTYNINGNTIYYSLSKPLQPKEGITVVVGFPKNIAAVLEPVEIVAKPQSLISKIIGAIFGFIFATVVPLGMLLWLVVYPIRIFLKWNSDKSNTEKKKRVVAAWFESPEGLNHRSLSPAETSAVVDKNIDHKDISATIIDLAQRGFLKINSENKLITFLKQKKYSDDSSLTNFEKELLNALFSNDTLDTRKLYDLTYSNSFFKNLTSFRKLVSQRLVDEGLFKDNLEKTSMFYGVIGVLALISMNFILAIVAFLLGRKSARKTDLGIEKYSEAFSLKNFLTSQDAQLNFQANNQMFFEKLLPYATAFGVEKVWAKKFEALKFTQPEWVEGADLQDVAQITAMSSILNTNIRTNAAAMTSTHSSSGFSSGFSGGSSGGGGGGGGTSSW
jgi:uncharacterized membrane protein